MEIANRETYGLLSVVVLLLIRQYPVDSAIQNFILRRMRRRRLRLRLLQSLQMLYLFYRNRRLQVARRLRPAWVFPRPQNWFQELLNRIWYVPEHLPRIQFNTAKMCPACAAVSCICNFLPPDWLNYSCG